MYYDSLSGPEFTHPVLAPTMHPERSKAFEMWQAPAEDARGGRRARGGRCPAPVNALAFASAITAGMVSPGRRRQLTRSAGGAPSWSYSAATAPAAAHNRGPSGTAQVVAEQ